MSGLSSLPASPNWRGMLRARAYRRQDSSGDDNIQPLTAQNRSFPWLLSPAPSQQPSLRFRPQAPPNASTLTAHHHHHHHHHTPFLTLALLKLHELMADYGKRLAQTAVSTQAAGKACSLLDTSVATATSPSTSPKNASPVDSPQQQHPSSPTSTSPLLTWLVHSSTSVTSPRDEPTSSALALEGEWDTYAAPFLLLAGAERLYHDMQYGRPLSGLYRRIQTDLTQVRTTLCDPFLGSTASPELSHTQAAVAVATWLQGLMALCAVRCQLLELWQSLFGNSNGDTRGEVRVALDLLLAPTAIKVFENIPEPLQTSLIQELQTWSYCLKATCALERCQFLDTMVSLRQWKRHLVQGDTRRVQWFQSSYQQVVAMVPLYMDRIHAFSGPLYGFEAPALRRSLKEDWDAPVLDFLRRQEKVGGPPTAVAIILDAQGTLNMHVERGFRLRADNHHINSNDETDLRVLWPAVFLRSTLHLASASQQQRMAVGGSSSRGSGLFPTATSSQSSLLPSWGTESPRVKSSTKTNAPRGKSFNWHVLEYGPDEGAAKSWPHSEWESLVALLDQQHHDMTDAPAAERLDATEGSESRLVEEPVAVTYVDDDEEDTKQSPAAPIEEAATSLFSVKLERSPQRSPTSKKGEKPSTTFHVVSLSGFLSMVVMVKGEEESMWHRRRNRLGDEEIRAFLDDMARRLRVSNLFSLQENSTGDSPKHSKGQPPPLHLTDSMVNWNDNDAQSFLSQLKDSFGLRPTNPLQDTSLGASRRTNRSPLLTPSGRRLRRRRIPASDLPEDESAAALFLGPDLAQLIID